MPALGGAECFSLLVMACFSWFVGNGFIRYCYDRFPSAAQLDSVQSEQDVSVNQNTATEQDAHPKSRINGVIGDLERVLYIYAVVRNQYSLISGWLVLKAFFGWVNNKAVSPGQLCGAETGEHKGSYRKYCFYVFGNGLSLAVGLACGEVALFLAEVARKTLA